MPTSPLDAIRDAIRLLREGAVQAADDLLSAAHRELSAAASAASGAGTTPLPPAPAPAPGPPRPVNQCLLDVVKWIASRMGNHPELQQLIADLEAAIGSL